MAKPDPNEEDLKKTACDIALNYGDKMKGFNSKFEKVAQMYHEYRKENLRTKIKDAEFHGARDFFGCIKLICSEILLNEVNNDDFVLNKIVSHAVSRNFGKYTINFSICFHLYKNLKVE